MDPAARRSLGLSGEAAAATWYLESGYEVLQRNWRCRLGEIDLVCRRGRVLVVCEVKTRTSDRLGSPLEAVTATKQRRLRRLAAAYLQQASPSPRPASVRFDVAGVVGDSVEVVEGAF